MSRPLKEYLPTPIRQIGFNILSTIQKKRWQLSGKPIPPPNKVKQEVVSGVAQEKNLKVLVETGTYLGNMIFAQRSKFKKIFSIELSPVFFEQAEKRFRRYSHIKILFGDSADVLPRLLKSWRSQHFFG